MKKNIPKTEKTFLEMTPEELEKAFDEIEKSIPKMYEEPHDKTKTPKVR